jgi:hypothetical protein
VRSGADYSILVIGLTAGIIGIVIAFSLYQFHFKYPPLVRKIRKLKKGIRKRLVKKPILVNSREDIIQESLNEKKNILEFETLNIEKTNIKEKKSIQKEGEL